ncbi:IS5 family transposase [Kibdelosporangium philippinense]|uniref:IS5 family transposase n=1 Tax=Kibdelosporangium philippinense TaxID=211113 RepID=A0ABS8ZIA6_9PSEU|nr:IS5 family transposase [Kibdelosporangium philippinense]MCE7007119.1 IS5 family transposase [Kibdelosporangium philippinense]
MFVRRGQQPPWIVSDELWARVEPLLPVVVPRRRDRPGRPRLDDRKALCGILFVLYTGIPWEFLPQELGFGSGMTCWRRLRDWNEAGVWQRLHESLLAELNAAGQLDWSRAVIDGSHVRAMKGGPKTGPSPVDRARTGSKHHLITEGHGIPLQVSLTGGNRNDVTQLMPLIQALPPVRGRRGRPRRRPDTVFADRAYDHDKYRKQVQALDITPIIARRGTAHGSGLGKYRWVVEQTFALLHWFRRLRIRWEIRDDIHEAFLRLGCAVICFRRLANLQLC